jgi:archaellum component FlaF (FlaF/FlaG flagellin family)
MSVTAIVFLISILIFVGIVNDSMTRTSPSRKKSQSSDYSNSNDTGSIGDT